MGAFGELRLHPRLYSFETLTFISLIADGSIGAFLLGTVFACFLSGLTSSQWFQYYQNFPIDRKLYKYLVGGLWILDLTHTAVSM